MNIYQRKDLRWQFNYTAKLFDGTSKRISIIHKDKGVVKKKARKALYEADNYMQDDIKLTLFIDEWFKLHKTKIEQTTAETYRIYIEKHIKPQLGELKLSEIKLLSLQSYFNAKAESLKHRSLKHIKSILSCCLTTAVKNGNLTSNPCAYIDITKKDAYQYDIYNREDLKKLMFAVKGTKDELVVALASMCGLRRAEIFGLTWDAVDFENNCLYIVKTAVSCGKEVVIKPPKNASSKRTVTVPKKIMSYLRQHRGIGYVIPGVSGQAMKGGSYSRHFKELLQKNNLKHTRLHDLRHFHATLLLQIGIDTKIVSARLGHSNTSTTQNIYQHVTKEMDKLVCEKLDAIL